MLWLIRRPFMLVFLLVIFLLTGVWITFAAVVGANPDIFSSWWGWMMEAFEQELFDWNFGERNDLT